MVCRLNERFEGRLELLIPERDHRINVSSASRGQIDGKRCNQREQGCRDQYGYGIYAWPWAQSRENVLWEVLRETLLLVLIGIILGVAIALGETHLVRSYTIWPGCRIPMSRVRRATL